MATPDAAAHKPYTLSTHSTHTHTPFSLLIFVSSIPPSWISVCVSFLSCEREGEWWREVEECVCSWRMRLIGSSDKWASRTLISPLRSNWSTQNSKTHRHTSVTSPREIPQMECEFLVSLSSFGVSSPLLLFSPLVSCLPFVFLSLLSSPSSYPFVSSPLWFPLNSFTFLFHTHVLSSSPLLFRSLLISFLLLPNVVAPLLSLPLIISSFFSCCFSLFASPLIHFILYHLFPLLSLFPLPFTVLLVSSEFNPH